MNDNPNNDQARGPESACKIMLLQQQQKYIRYKLRATYSFYTSLGMRKLPAQRQSSSGQ